MNGRYVSCAPRNIVNAVLKLSFRRQLSLLVHRIRQVHRALRADGKGRMHLRPFRPTAGAMLLPSAAHIARNSNVPLSVFAFQDVERYSG